MKIIVDDFNYRGQHFDHFECDLPQVHNADEIDSERMTDYLKESLDEFFKEV